MGRADTGAPRVSSRRTYPSCFAAAAAAAAPAVAPHECPPPPNEQQAGGDGGGGGGILDRALAEVEALKRQMAEAAEAGPVDQRADNAPGFTGKTLLPRA